MEEPVQYRLDGPTVPPKTPDGVTVISVPAVVTEREAHYVGETRSDIRVAEETVPLSSGKTTLGDELGDKWIDRATGSANQLLDWGDPAPPPAGIEILYPDNTVSAGFATIENGRVTFSGESPTTILLSRLVANGIDPHVAYDAGSKRFLVFAMIRESGRSAWAVQLGVSAASDDNRSWYTLLLEPDNKTETDTVTIDLLAHDRQALYVRTAAVSVDSSEATRRSVWIVSKGIYAGENTTVTRVVSRR